MVSEQTWEFIVQPERPIPMDDLEVIVTEGEPLVIGHKRPDLYNEVLEYWNKAQEKMIVARAQDLADALSKKDMQKIARMTRQIGGVNQKHRLSRAVLDGNRLYLAMNSTQYMDFIGTNERSVNDLEFRAKLMQAGIEDYADPEKYFANALAVCAVVHGLDDRGEVYVPINMRSDKVMIYPNVHHVFGGMVDVDDKRTKVNIGAHSRLELREEIGLEDSQIGVPTFYGVVRQRPSRIPEAILSIPVFLGKKEIIERWKKNAPGKYESRNISFYRVEEIGDFLNQYGTTMVPSGAAALTEFVRHQSAK